MRTNTEPIQAVGGAAAAMNGRTPLVTLLMIVTERDQLLARYAVPSCGRIHSALQGSGRDFVLCVYLNCLSAEAKAACIRDWQPLPWVVLYDNAEKLQGRRLGKGESITSPEGVVQSREGESENCDEVWSAELAQFTSKYVGTIDADFEVLHPDFFLHALDRLERDENLAGFSSDHDATRVHFDSYSNETVILHERWHTWFCLYRSAHLRRARISHFFAEFRMPNGMRYVYDSAARLQAELVTTHGFGFGHLPREFHASFIHYGASSKLRTLTAATVGDYRRTVILVQKGLLRGAHFNRHRVVRWINRLARRLATRAYQKRFQRYEAEKATV